MHQVRFICFIGIDGSGKTTLAKKVVEELKSENFLYVHSLIEARLLKPFLALGRTLLVKNKSREKDYVEFSRLKRERFSKIPLLYFFYKIIVFIDYVPQIFRKIIIPLKKGNRIISDRYVYDTFINMNMNKGCDIQSLSKSINSFFKFFPKPDITFLVDIPEEVAFLRKNDVPDIAYLKEKRPIYIELAKLYDMPVLDGAKPVEVLVTEVMKHIGRFST